MAAPPYNPHPTARSGGRQAAKTAGHHPTPTHPPTRTDPRRLDWYRPTPARSATAEQPSGTVLRHGYTYDEIEALARRVAKMNAAAGIHDPDDRYEIAFSAIVDRLYTAQTRPGAGHLFNEARTALYTAFLTQQRQRGIPFDAPGKSNQALRFRQYWNDWATRSTTASPERRVVEPMAVEQILPLLAPAERAALLALAEHESYVAAAAALGLSRKTFSCYVSKARRRFRVWWHEGETPSGQWRHDHYDRDGYVQMGLCHKRDTCQCATCIKWRAARAKRAEAEGEAVGA